jgi:hypothetical protein
MHRRRGLEADIRYAEAYIRAGGKNMSPELPVSLWGHKN